MENQVTFPKFSGIRCLMMPFIQGDPDSVPEQYSGYRDILASQYLEKGDIGYLTIDESRATAGRPHRGAHSKHARALHTEVGRLPQKVYCWGNGGGWGRRHKVLLDRDVQVLLSNNLDRSCAVWDAEHEDTSIDGDIGHLSELYPYETAYFLGAGEVRKIGILTPHESLPVEKDFDRQFLRIISSGVHGREAYFTINPLLSGFAG